MEFVFSRKEQQTQILYGETLNAVLRTQEISNDQVIILTNQRYYDRFSEKLTRLFYPKKSAGIFVPIKCIAIILRNFRPLCPS